jgi:hypothetical protein
VLVVLSTACALTASAASVRHSRDTATARFRSHATGAWTLDSIATPAGKTLELTSVSCVSSTWCLAIGALDATTGSVDPTITVEEWNGTTWLPSAAPATPSNASNTVFYGVSCVSSTFCMAVGSYERGSGTLALTDQWNGTAWSEVPVSPGSGIRVSQLRSVSCVSTSSCTAVGDGDKHLASAVTIGEHFNGVKWTSQTIPFPAGATYVQLQGVSCASSEVCVAVGTVGNRSESSGAEFTLADRWNGTKWVLLSSVNTPGELYRGFEAVSCPNAGYCVAVGNVTNRAGTNATLSEVLSGNRWSRANTPATPGGEFRNLNGVSCVSSTDCTAVGFFDTSQHVYLSLADQWNGNSWTSQGTPSVGGATYSELFGVSCSTAACLAVGTGIALSNS